MGDGFMERVAYCSAATWGGMRDAAGFPWLNES